MTPDSARHNPAPAFLRRLLQRAALSQRVAAARIGMSAAGLQNYLRAPDDPKYRPAPYHVQVALELLAGGLRLDAETLHNPTPDFLRSRLQRAGLSQRDAAARIGMSAAGLQNYLRAPDDPKYRPAPYTVQVAIEALAAA